MVSVAPQGRCAPGFGGVRDVFGRLVASGAGGAAVAVRHRREVVVDLWGGEAGPGRPWEAGTAAMSYSTSKGVVATAAHRLVAAGRLDLDAPVVEYWPEFATHGKAAIRVHHLLDHSAGMHRIRDVIPHAEWMLDWKRMVDALAATPAAWPPGERSGYHALTYGWLVGEVLTRITGTGVNDSVADLVARPLGICDEMGIGAGALGERTRASAVRRSLGGPRTMRAVERLESWPPAAESIRAFAVDGVDVMLWPSAMGDAEIPAVNGYFTARALAAMYDAVGSDSSFLDPATRAAALTPGPAERDAVVGFPMRWRRGYHVAATMRGVLPSGFGHFGFGGSGAWYDPRRELAMAFVTNRVGSVTSPFADTRILRLGHAAVRAAAKLP